MRRDTKIPVYLFSFLFQNCLSTGNFFQFKYHFSLFKIQTNSLWVFYYLLDFDIYSSFTQKLFYYYEKEIKISFYEKFYI